MDNTLSSSRPSRASNWIRALAAVLIGGGLSISLVGAACRSSAAGPGNTFSAEPLTAIGGGVAAAILVLALASIALGVLLLHLTPRLDGRAAVDA